MLKVEPVALTDVGRKRSTNQDYLGDLIFRSGRKYGQEKLDERGYLFAVADGMGGYAGGEVASELAITTLFERFYNGPTSGDVASDLSEAIRLANAQVHETAASSGRPQMGTTLTTVLLKGNKAIFGNVGDSRTYLIRQGLPERVTHDHSLVQDQIDAGVLTPEQAERSSIKNFITRAIGHRSEVESDLFEREIMAGDVLLLCSDGLHGLVKEMEMGTIVATTPKLQDAARQLLDMALERGGNDNISVILVRVLETGDPLPPILNGREAKYNAYNPIFSQVTEEIPLVTPPADFEEPTTIAATERPTTRMAAAPAPVVAPPAEIAETTIRPSATPKRPKTGGKGLLLGLLLLLLVGGGALAYVLLSGGSPAPPPLPVPVQATPALTPIPVPSPSPTITASPSATAPPALPTATLLPPTTVALAGANPVAPAPSGTRTAGAAGSQRTSSTGGAQALATSASNGGPALPGSGFSEPNLPAIAAPPGMTPWPFNSASQIQKIQVRLPAQSGSFNIRLVRLPTVTSSPSTSSLFVEQGAGSGIYELLAPNLSAGEYRLEITRLTDTAISSSFGGVAMKVEADRVWTEPRVRLLLQQNNTLVIELN